MIDFYTAGTPNGQKVHIMLEELGIPFTMHTLDLKAGQQKSPEYLKVNPNGKIPAIIDNDAPFGRKIPVFESGAILIYLAEKSNHFIGSNEFERAQTMSWLMFQMSGIGPILGNYNYAKTNSIPPMMSRFEAEAKRVFAVMNLHLGQNQYLAGDFYSIADMATYPWLAGTLKSKPEWFETTPNIRRWLDLVGQRPAIKKVFAK